MQQLQALAKGLPIRFLGPIHDIEMLNKSYERASIFIYPSVAEKGETFGLAPLEAMAWGCVPVVSDLACFKDFIIDGRNGVTFDHRSPDAVALLVKQIESLIKEPETRNRMAFKAVEVRESHSAVSVAQRFLIEFEKMNKA